MTLGSVLKIVTFPVVALVFWTVMYGVDVELASSNYASGHSGVSK